MKPKKQLKQLCKFLNEELIQAKANLDNGCFPHPTPQEEAIAKTHYYTLIKVNNYIELLKYK